MMTSISVYRTLYYCITCVCHSYFYFTAYYTTLVIREPISLRYYRVLHKYYIYKHITSRGKHYFITFIVISCYC